MIETARVEENAHLCRDHLRLTFRAPGLPSARPGQFVHLRPDDGVRAESAGSAGESLNTLPHAVDQPAGPLLRRAFSIAGLRRDGEDSLVDVIYRVVGAATRWMATLGEGDRLSVLGPAGNAFPIDAQKADAWLVAGGVGLPPMLWLAEALHQAGKRTVAMCGAQSADLLPLTMDQSIAPDKNAREALSAAREFGERGANVIISTDDGSCGFHGHVGAALEVYHQANPIDPDTLVVYACGPELMLECVGTYCLQRGIRCYICMERSMACGTGLCQSCVVPVRDKADPDGWSYRLCCTDGPVFDAAEIVWPG
jgi:dihydroorotate dehydrogenase electron transfer subunit